MIEIHPTAIVEKGAKRGKGCVVGPGAIVGGEVELEKHTKQHQQKRI